MRQEIKDELITKIIDLEYEITIAIIKGHRPYVGDCYQSNRDELKLLRCLVFGYESQFCKK